MATSTDGGDTWINRQVTPATDNVASPQGFGRSGCTVRTDRQGVVHVFVYQFAFGLPGVGTMQLIKSFDAGAHWTRPRNLFTAVDATRSSRPSAAACRMASGRSQRPGLRPERGYRQRRTNGGRRHRSDRADLG